MSPSTALYFACRSDFDEDGELWAVPFFVVNEAFGETHFLDDERVTPDGKRVADQPFTGAETVPNRVLFVRTAYHSLRSAAQQGIFSVADDLLADHADLTRSVVGAAIAERAQTDPRWNEHRVHCIRVSSAAKEALLRELWFRNVHALSLFPDTQGLGDYLQDMATLNPHFLDKAQREIAARIRAEWSGSGR